MNKFIGIGHLTRDVEIRYSQGENSTAVARFNVAFNRKFKRDGEQDADFINCVAFGKTAEFVEKYFSKGSKIVVVGRITTGSYTNKEGQKVYTTDITVEEVEFGESKGTSGVGNKPTEKGNINEGFMSIPDDNSSELPFD